MPLVESTVSGKEIRGDDIITTLLNATLLSTDKNEVVTVIAIESVPSTLIISDTDISDGVT